MDHLVGGRRRMTLDCAHLALNVLHLQSFPNPSKPMVIIALDSNSDRYGNVTNSQYIMGFMWDVLGSALHRLIFALSELVFIKYLGRRSFHVLLEQQVMVSSFAFVLTTIGIALNHDFQGMADEARTFKGGKSSYYLVMTWATITFQLGVLGGTAVLFLSSTILAGVLNGVRVPLTSIADVILLKDPMSGFKILSLVITIWGLASFICGNASGTSFGGRREPFICSNCTVLTVALGAMTQQ